MTWTGWLIIVWVVSALLAAMIGARKGEATMGCLGGMILGPIGLALIVISSGKVKYCPQCGETVKIDAKVCKHCKSKI